MGALALAIGGAVLLMASLAALPLQMIDCGPDDCGLGTPARLLNVLVIVVSAGALGLGLHTRLRQARDESEDQPAGPP